MKFYKVLNVDGSCCHGGVGKWPLPVNGEPGAWMPPVQGELVPCENGYHVLKFNQLVKWLGPAIVEVEIRGSLIEQKDKCVTREARTLRVLDAWNEKASRLFACDCAERVLHLFEAIYPNDARPRTAIKVARRFANGEATVKELVAARDAASHARDAASHASDAASFASYAASFASYAASDAASHAASDAASYAEKEWQTSLLAGILGIEED